MRGLIAALLLFGLLGASAPARAADYCYVAPKDLSKPWAKFEYNSRFGCQDWLGGINETTANHPYGYAGKAGVGLGADGQPGTGCGYDNKDVNGTAWWAVVFYPDNIGGAYKLGYQDRDTCLAVRSALAKRKWIWRRINKKRVKVTGQVSADCIFNGDTGE